MSQARLTGGNWQVNSRKMNRRYRVTDNVMIDMPLHLRLSKALVLCATNGVEANSP